MLWEIWIIKEKNVLIKENKPNLGEKKLMFIILGTDEKKEKENIDDGDEFLTDDLKNSIIQLKNTKLSDEKSKYLIIEIKNILMRKKENISIEDLDNNENKDKVLVADKHFKENNNNLEKGDLKKI